MSSRPQVREDLRRDGEPADRAGDDPETRLREELLAMVSHELRSPLNGIKSWAHVLENHAQEVRDPTVQRATAGILTGVEQQVRLIEELLDTARAINGTLALVKRPLALAPFLAGAIDEAREAAEQKGVRLLADIRLAGAEVLGDEGRVHQIFSSLIANAIRFTRAGGTVRVTGQADRAMARIEVKDDGTGIAPDDLPYVFDPFRQAVQAGRGRGLGLGLALAQRLVELHGGRIACESEGVAKGATFRVSLPLRRDV